MSEFITVKEVTMLLKVNPITVLRRIKKRLYLPYDSVGNLGLNKKILKNMDK